MQVFHLPRSTAPHTTARLEGVWKRGYRGVLEGVYRPPTLALRESTAVLGLVFLPLSPLSAYVASADWSADWASRLRGGGPADAGRAPRLTTLLIFSATWHQYVLH